MDEYLLEAIPLQSGTLRFAAILTKTKDFIVRKSGLDSWESFHVAGSVSAATFAVQRTTESLPFCSEQRTLIEPLEGNYEMVLSRTTPVIFTHL